MKPILVDMYFLPLVPHLPRVTLTFGSWLALHFAMGEPL